MTGANVKIMPPFIPRPVAMVEVIGAFEILGGLRIDRAVGRSLSGRSLYGVVSIPPILR
jgi:uncharacterized membrane protein